jgi:hypothetical protein
VGLTRRRLKDEGVEPSRRRRVYISNDYPAGNEAGVTLVAELRALKIVGLAVTTFPIHHNITVLV